MHINIYAPTNINLKPRAFVANFLCKSFATFLLLTFHLPAFAQTDSVLHDQKYLRYYPSLEQVRADVVARSGSLKPEEIDGRISGRLYVLAEILKESYGGDFGRPGDRGRSSFRNTAPAKVKELYDSYMGEWQRNSSFGAHPSPETCHGHSEEEQKLMGNCTYINYASSEIAEGHGDNAIKNVATLYFPEPYRTNVIDLFQQRNAEHEAFRNAEDQKRQQREAEAQKDGTRRWGEALAMIMLTVVLGIGSLAMLIPGIRLARKNIKTAKELDKYEFDNRTDGGVVEFKNYDSAVEHRNAKGNNLFSFNFAFLLILFGVIGLLFTSCSGMVSLAALGGAL
jgi:hypothetical protein